jgi:hydroxyacylglutathione hydrolase
MSAGKLKVDVFTGGAFAQNGFVVSCTSSGKGILVDPGASVGEMVRSVEASDIEIQAIIVTHAHLDHIEGVAEARRRTGARIHLHRDDLPLYGQAGVQAQMFGMPIELPPPVDEFMTSGEVIRVGECELTVRHTPGHSPGHVTLVGDGLALVADCVFLGSIGRTDLPGGNFETLIASIRSQILTLPDETVLYPGHGSTTTVGHERRTNPFLAGGSSFA